MKIGNVDYVELFKDVCLWCYIEGKIDAIYVDTNTQQEKFKMFYKMIDEKSLYINSSNFKDVLLCYIKENNLFKVNNSAYKNKRVNKNNMRDLNSIRGNIVPHRQTIAVKRIDRKQNLVQGLKTLYNNECQICRNRVEIGLNEHYSEVHHVKPLGNHHGGPDIIQNMIVLCPNCHVLFDRGAIGINILNMTVMHCNTNNLLNGKSITLRHKINHEFLQYHNENIYLKQDTAKEITNLSMIETVTCTSDKVVNYGDEVSIMIQDTKEVVEIKLETYYNRTLMTEIQKKLIGHKINDKVDYLENGYYIVGINRWI